LNLCILRIRKNEDDVWLLGGFPYLKEAKKEKGDNQT